MPRWDKECSKWRKACENIHGSREAPGLLSKSNSGCFGLTRAQSAEVIWRGLIFSKVGCNSTMGDLECLAKESRSRQKEGVIWEPYFQRSKLPAVYKVY